MNKEEKLEHLRHSLAHLLAAAVLDLYPDTKLTLGPAIENGFYYDVDTSTPLAEADLPKIEKRMKKILQGWKEFSGKEVSADEAREIYKGNEYKLELIADIEKRGEKITLYTCGEFTDLCRGGHVENAKEINPEAFTLTHLAGAYWRGDEKNKMLTRIYGLAFETKEELEKHLEMLEEAKKRDHRRLGKELDLFVSSELVGAGLPLFTPKGTVLREELEGYVRKLREAAGFEYVWIPHIAKDDLYKTSGHWDKFEDDIFHVKSKKTDTGFVIKPMNCPHHTQIYAAKAHSYKDLPVRYAGTTTIYRDENTGQLQGLTRVRSITQDDSHVFCRKDQIKEEAKISQRIITDLYKTFDIGLKIRLSTHDSEKMDKYLGEEKLWDWAEDILKELITEDGHEYFIGKGEAAFYGPKIDYIGIDSLGREWQLATIQLDFNQPARFELKYITEKNEKEHPFMIHVAAMGSTERFMGILIEHFAGKFPVWLSPVQVRVIAVSDKFQDYAKGVVNELKDEGIRTNLAPADETLGKRIRAAEQEKIPYVLVVGEEEAKTKKVAVRHYTKSDMGKMSLDEFTALIKKETKEKTR